MTLRPALVLLGLCTFAACTAARYDNNTGPGVTLPAHFAEGRNEPAADAGADAAPKLVEPEPKGSLPDPEALHEARQWEYDILYDHGKVSVQKVRLLHSSTPVPSQRHMGRYAIELWIGKELVDRIRFDFPLLGAEEPEKKRKPLHAPPTFAAGAVVTRKVLVPASARATRALLVDRATGEQQILPWPPDAPLGPPRTKMPPKKAVPDAGAPDSGPTPDE